MEKREIRIIYSYEFKLGHTASEAAKNINAAFGEGIASDRTIRRWFEKFRSGDTNLENEPRGHKPAAIQDLDLKQIVERDSRETIIADKHCQEIDIMNEKLSVQQSALVNKRGVILLHDNARLNIAKETVKKLAELKCEVLPHPHYSTDLSPTGYHFFKHLDGFLNGRIFQEERAVKTAFDELIASRLSDFYQKGIEALASRWKKCIDVDGNYFT